MNLRRRFPLARHRSEIVGSTFPWRIRIAVIAVAAMGGGIAFGWASRQLPATPAYAACGTSHGIVCSGPKSSLVEVEHQIYAADPKVEPDSGETWSVTAYWASTSGGGACPCTETSASATVRVDWNPTYHRWDIACTSGCDAYAGPLYSFEICDDTQCVESVGTYHSWRYVIEGKIDETQTVCGSRPAYLDRVVYTTSSVDDGDKLSSTGRGCYELLSVTPTTQAFSVTDYGANQGPGSFVCYPSDCSGATPITLTYQ
jgi:hypothetical protein